MKVNHYKAVRLADNEGGKYDNLTKGLLVSPNFCITKPLSTNQVNDRLIRAYNNGRTVACYTRWQNELVLTHIHTGAKLGKITCSKPFALSVIQELEAAYNWNFSDRVKWDKLSKRKKSSLYEIVKQLRKMA